jgi:ankyrin repeat protein
MGDKKISYNIFLAAMEGAGQEISSILEAGESVNSTSEYGETPLHFASGFNEGQIVCFLISNGAQLEARNVWGETPLFYALKNENWGNAKLLVENGADVNATLKRNTDKAKGLNTLQFLIGNIPDHETAKILIANNVDINAIDHMGMTPLDWTKGRNGEKGAIAKTLCDHGAKTAKELKAEGI